MKPNKYKQYLLILSLVVTLTLLSALEAGCAIEPVDSITTNLAATLIPDLDLDAYLYFNQGSPTVVPKALIGLPSDITVDSLAVWGRVDGNQYALSGALTFANTADADHIYAQVSQQTGFWSKLSDRTVYSVYGSGGLAESFKHAISNNHFKHYDDSKALAEVSLLPYSNNTKPVGIGILKPTPAAINLLKPYLDANTSATIDNIYTWAKPQLITLGLYSSQVIDLADIVQRINANTLRDINLGAVVSVSSSIPGVVFSPLAGKFLDDSGYSITNLGDLNVYKVSIDSGNGKTLPVFFSVEGNHVFATSGREDYAEALMTDIIR